VRVICDLVTRLFALTGLSSAFILKMAMSTQMILRFFSLFALAGVMSVLASCATTGITELPQGAPATESSSAEAPLRVDEYKLGRGDQISIQVFDEPDLSIAATVGASGIISYSYLGDVRVSGKTVDEVEDTISELLENGYLVNPSVNVTVTQFRSFFINGEVRSPGSYAYQPGLTLDKAIALAGGLTDRASARKMFVVRGESDDSSPAKINLGDSIYPGDIVSIEEGFF